MKLDLFGIRFRMFMFYLIFSIGIIFLIGFLQFTLIRPYYRQNKINTVSEVSNTIQSYIVDKTPTEDDVANAFQTTVDNNVCVVLVNDNGEIIYDVDSLGSACVFHAQPSDIDIPVDSLQDGKNLIRYFDDGNEEINETINNLRTKQEMILYGKKISSNLGNYYLFVNSPLEPVDSILRFFSRQYIYYTIIVLIAASIISYYLSKSLSQPIISMRDQAAKLAHADYTARFEGGEYTETKELANTLNSATNQLSKIDELRKDLIANVSHDFKTPLTSIKAYAEMIKDISGNNPEKREEHLNVIMKEADYLDHLVLDMSELSKMQSGNYVLHLDNFDLCELIYETIDLYEPLINGHKLKLNTEINDEELIVYADEVKIFQVISNFLSNAIKHTPEGKNIYIKAYHLSDDEVKVEINDEGEGISEEDLPFIWDRYQKASQSFSRNLTSTGLGLSIVKAILDTHKAQYGVDSKLGEGSSFWFILKRPDVEEMIDDEV